jgi:ABC-type Zn2+ transport system substrate-binding protein/surface adhesin
MTALDIARSAGSDLIGWLGDAEERLLSASASGETDRVAAILGEASVIVNHTQTTHTRTHTHTHTHTHHTHTTHTRTHTHTHTHTGEASVNVNHAGQGGVTPLIAAVRGGHADVANMLMRANADVFAKDAVSVPTCVLLFQCGM